MQGHTMADDGYDRGWSWVVLCAACLSNCMTLAPFQCASIINSFFLETFNESRSYTAVPVAIMMGMINIFGIPASIIDNRLGPGVTLVIGSLMSTTGLALSAYCTSVGMAIPTLGFLCGCGLACSNLSGLTVIPLYFRKYRTFAFNVIVAGASAGRFVHPPFISAFVNIYSWRGTLLIISGFLLQGCVFALLFRSKERKRLVKEYHKQMIQEFENETQNCHSTKKQEYVLQNKYKLNPLVSKGACVNGGSKSLMSLRSLQKQKGSQDNLENGSAIITRSQLRLNGNIGNGSVMENGSTHTLPGSYFKSNVDPSKCSPMSCQMHTLGVKEIEVHSSWSVLAIDEDGEVHNFALNEPADSHVTGQTCFAKISKYYHLDILRNKRFLSILGTCVFRACGKGTVSLYLTDLLLSNGYELDFVAQIFVVIGASQLVSVPIIGFIANRLMHYNIYFWTIGLVFTGILTLVTTMVIHDKLTLCVVLALYGVGESNFDSMWGAVITDTLDVNRIGNGAGTAACVYGVTIMLSSLVTGWLADSTGNYIVCWYFAGVAYFISAMTTLLCAYLIHKKRVQETVTTNIGDNETL